MLVLICTDVTGFCTEPKAHPFNLSVRKNDIPSYTHALIRCYGRQIPTAQHSHPFVGWV